MHTMNGTEAFGLFVILPVFVLILKLATDPFQKTEMAKINHSIKLQDEEWAKEYKKLNPPICTPFDYAGLTPIEAKRQKILDDIKLSLKTKPACECFLIIQEHEENFIVLSFYYDTMCVSTDFMKNRTEKALKKFSQYLERENISPDYEICIITS